MDLKGKLRKTYIEHLQGKAGREINIVYMQKKQDKKDINGLVIFLI